EELRLAWLDDADPVVASAGWALTADRVVKKPEGLALSELLDVIEAEMADAHERLQWEMNTTLAHIGIENPELRARALEMGERRSEEHTSELQSRFDLVCRLLLEKKK